MASATLVEDPRPTRRSWNHPCHIHALIKTDTREIYGSYGGHWRCDLCQLEFKHQPETLLLATHEDNGGEPRDHTYSYHCSECMFDVCNQCFHGYHHPFHPHRLKQAKPDLIYQDTEGQWKCDACQRVFLQVNNGEQCYHCTECQVDLCQKCFIGEWSHTLHEDSNHHLKPVDPRLEYRRFSSWVCDNCEKRFTFEDEAHLLYHCSTCQFDLCTPCFRGAKHHLHGHGLVQVSRIRYGPAKCSNCSKYTTELTYHKCVESSCGFTLCAQCHVTSPRLHPSHAHPLVVCDPLEVYPQSGGLWHCDNCTAMHPRGEQTPLPPTQTMYHCGECDFDLCQSCYTTPHSLGGQYSGGSTNRLSSELVVPIRAHQPRLEGLTNHRPLSYVTSPDTLTSLSPPISYLTSLREFSLRTCSVCQRYTATKFFVHGFRTCSEWPVVCEGCADKVLLYGRTCPHCGCLPAGVTSKP